MTLDPRMSEWGNPAERPSATYSDRSERRELKHLITCRKRK